MNNSFVSHKTIRLLASITCVLCLFATFSRAESTNGFGFSVRPGTKAWAELRSLPAMIGACEMPVTTAKQLSTLTLVQLCIDYPLTRALYFLRSPDFAYTTLKENFSGWKELVTRTDSYSNVVVHLEHTAGTVVTNADTKAQIDLSRNTCILLRLLREDAILSTSNRTLLDSCLLQCLLLISRDEPEVTSDTIELNRQLQSTVNQLIARGAGVSISGTRHTNIPTSDMDALIRFSKNLKGH